MRTWHIEFYEHWNLISHAYIKAKTRAEALHKLHEQHHVVEVVCCRAI